MLFTHALHDLVADVLKIFFFVSNCRYTLMYTNKIIVHSTLLSTWIFTYSCMWISRNWKRNNFVNNKFPSIIENWYHLNILNPGSSFIMASAGYQQQIFFMCDSRGEEQDLFNVIYLIVFIQYYLSNNNTSIFHCPENLHIRSLATFYNIILFVIAYSTLISLH